LLRTKWQRYGRWLYWLNLFTFFGFLTFITLYAILLPPPNTGQCKIYFVFCDYGFEFYFTILPGNGGAERCDGPIINGTIVNDAGDTVGLVRNFIIIVNGSEVPDGRIMDDIVFYDNMTGNVIDIDRIQVKCDCEYSTCIVW